MQHATGEAKVWLEPSVELAQNYGLSTRRIGTVLQLTREHEGDIRKAWESHFGR